ncbi:MAG: heavy metal-associated domain-containing protein [candidate division Zixibacteria bacterium]
MKLKGYFLILPVVLFLLGCASTKPDINNSDGNSEIRVFEVYGMNCPGCHGGVEKLVNKVPGILSSKADWEKEKIEVVVKPGIGLTDEAIIEAVKKANFTPGKRIE